MNKEITEVYIFIACNLSQSVLQIQPLITLMPFQRIQRNGVVFFLQIPIVLYFCNTNKFTLCCSRINYAVKGGGGGGSCNGGKGRKVKMRNSVCCALVEYSYKINFWCFRALFVPGRQSQFLFVKLLGTSKWVNLLCSEKKGVCASRKTYVRWLWQIVEGIKSAAPTASATPAQIAP